MKKLRFLFSCCQFPSTCSVGNEGPTCRLVSQIQGPSTITIFPRQWPSDPKLFSKAVGAVLWAECRLGVWLICDSAPVSLSCVTVRRWLPYSSLSFLNVTMGENDHPPHMYNHGLCAREYTSKLKQQLTLNSAFLSF